MNNQNNLYLNTLLYDLPQAYAAITGSAQYPGLYGEVTFYGVPEGVLVFARITGLPTDPGTCQGSIYGFHIHAGGSCSGTKEEPFKNAGGHYNPGDCPHPAHAGDLPSLFGNNSFAWSAFLTDRFKVSDIIGKTLIIHAKADDFTSQPSGAAGTMIGCGRINTVDVNL